MSGDGTSGPLRVALTGGIGTGKSYCLRKLAEAGAATIDADVLARQAVAPGTAGFAAIRARFGGAVVTADGGLDRDALARIIFTDADARRAVEAIIHPTVYRAIQRWFEGLRSAQTRVAVADIPLLFETGHEGDFDRVIVTTCRPDQQVARVMARGLDAADAARRIAAQLPLEDKVRRADLVVDTSGSFEDTDAHVRRVWEELTTRHT